MPTVLHTATVLCSMLGPPEAGGGLLVRGDRILSVGDAARLRRDADRTVHHDGVLLPGLVDARTRVEDADLPAPGGPPGGLPPAPPAWTGERWGRSARRGVHALLRAGVAGNGDVVRRGPGVPACVRAGLLGDSWLHIAGVDRREHDEVLAATARSLALPAAGRRIGLNPEPLALSTGVLQALSVLATGRRAPVHLAVGRDPAERDALASARGPLADAARARGWQFEWLDHPTRMQPLAYLGTLGLVTSRSSIAWAGDLTPREAALLARQRATVVLCEVSPGPEEPGVPLRPLADAGARLALGSDGGGDVLAAAAAWASSARGHGLARWPGPAGPLDLEEAALRLVTADGARAMGWGEEAGVLAAGRRADFVVLDLDSTPGHAYGDVVHAGAGRQVLTVLGGVRRARRASAELPWPPVETDEEHER